jgi:hypothetical protein
LEPLALLFNMLFENWDNEDDRLREMIRRVEFMARHCNSARDEELNKRVDRLIEPRKAVAASEARP